jgi:glycosyltransferase involved in cell wall biosynthesis
MTGERDNPPPVPRRPVSVCIITKDEEENLPDCLSSVSWADEIVVVDSRSKDRTREIASAAGARVVERDFPGHVEQKNFAVEQARNDWVLCIDADERLSPELAGSVRRALEEPGDRAGYECARLTFHSGTPIRHGGWYPDRKLRLFDRRRARWGGRNPHDRVEADGPVGRLEGDLLHHSYRSISDHLRQIDFFTAIAAKEKRARGERASAWKLVLRPAWKFVRMYLLKAGFLDGTAGFVVAVTGAYYVFLKYARLRELERADG